MGSESIRGGPVARRLNRGARGRRHRSQLRRGRRRVCGKGRQGEQGRRREPGAGRGPVAELAHKHLSPRRRLIECLALVVEGGACHQSLYQTFPLFLLSGLGTNTWTKSCGIPRTDPTPRRDLEGSRSDQSIPVAAPRYLGAETRLRRTPRHRPPAAAPDGPLKHSTPVILPVPTRDAPAALKLSAIPPSP